MFDWADLKSLQLLYAAFTQFSQASSLKENLDKSNIYITGVDMVQKDMIQQVVSMPHRVFLFKYLGVPLSTRKLFYYECNPLR